MTNITTTTQSGYAPLSVSFTFTTNKTVSASLWNFGDGETSTETNPTHYYTCPGIYSVSLVINSGTVDEDSSFKSNLIIVLHHSPTMPNESCCLGPYEIDCIDCTSGSGTQFVDSTKLYRTCKNVSCSKTCQEIYGDIYTIIDDNDNCPSCKECYLEHKTTLGRIYTVIPSACSVFISGYDFSQDCGECLGQAEEFCFSMDLCEQNSSCATIFSFDNHTFSIRGTKSTCTDGFDCGDCWIAPNAFSESVFGNVPSTSTCIDEEETATTTTETSPDILWHNIPSGDSGIGVDCNAENEITSASEAQSQQHPVIDTMPSGDAIIAFEERVDGAINKISLSEIKTTVKNSVLAWRSHSGGTLVNQGSLSGIITFRIYEKAKVEVGHGIGFLSGPLAGKTYEVLSATQVWDENDFYWEVTFNSDNPLGDS